MSRLVVLAEYWNVYDAAIAVSALESAGIPAINPDWHLFHLKPHLMYGATGARLWVLEQDFEQSTEILFGEHTKREPIYTCPDTGEEAYRSSFWSALGFVIAYVLAGVGASAVVTGIVRRSRRFHCPGSNTSFHIPPPEPFTEEELGYDGYPPKLGGLAKRAFRRFMDLRKL